jgi:hypothetical protein
MAQLRRSHRLPTNDSNGRDYLSELLGLSREELEAWIASPSAHPHLQLWYHLCVSDSHRYNDAANWINTSPKGYYFNTSDLEEDLLLMCLGEGESGEGSEDGTTKHADNSVKTGKWITQELWARTAWRIVQDNKYKDKDKDQVFAPKFKEHPAWCYAFAIDLLCIAFHSIAHRGKGSCYY